MGDKKTNWYYLYDTKYNRYGQMMYKDKLNALRAMTYTNERSKEMSEHEKSGKN